MPPQDDFYTRLQRAYEQTAPKQPPKPAPPRPAVPRPSGTPAAEMAEIARSRGYRVTSTTGGRHNPNSLHPQGRAIDIGARDLEPDDVDAVTDEFAGRGYTVLNEIERPAGQREWSGPHLHVEADDLVPMRQTYARMQARQKFERLKEDAAAAMARGNQADADELLKALRTHAKKFAVDHGDVYEVGNFGDGSAQWPYLKRHGAPPSADDYYGPPVSQAEARRAAENVSERSQPAIPPAQPAAPKRPSLPRGPVVGYAGGSRPLPKQTQPEFNRAMRAFDWREPVAPGAERPQVRNFNQQVAMESARSRMAADATGQRPLSDAGRTLIRQQAAAIPLGEQSLAADAERRRLAGLRGKPFAQGEADVAFENLNELPDSSLTPEEREQLRIQRMARGVVPPPLPSGLRQAANNLVQSTLKGAAALPEGAGEVIDTLGNYATRAAQAIDTAVSGAPAQPRRNLPADYFASGARPLTNQANRVLESTIPTDPNDQSWLTGKIPQAAGSTVPMVAAGLASGGSSAVAALVGAVQNAQQIAREFDQAGGDPTRRDAAVGAAIPVGLLEAAGLGRIAKWMGPATLNARLLNLAEEYGQEWLSQTLNNLIASKVGGYDPNRPATEGSNEAGLLGLLVGGPLHAPGLVGAGQDALRRRREVPQIQAEPSATTMPGRPSLRTSPTQVVPQAQLAAQQQQAAPTVTQAAGDIRQATDEAARNIAGLVPPTEAPGSEQITIQAQPGRPPVGHRRSSVTVDGKKITFTYPAEAFETPETAQAAALAKVQAAQAAKPPSKVEQREAKQRAGYASAADSLIAATQARRDAEGRGDLDEAERLLEAEAAQLRTFPADKAEQREKLRALDEQRKRYAEARAQRAAASAQAATGELPRAATNPLAPADVRAQAPTPEQLIEQQQDDIIRLSELRTEAVQAGRFDEAVNAAQLELRGLQTLQKQLPGPDEQLAAANAVTRLQRDIADYERQREARAKDAERPLLRPALPSAARPNAATPGRLPDAQANVPTASARLPVVSPVVADEVTADLPTGGTVDVAERAPTGPLSPNSEPNAQIDASLQAAQQVFADTARGKLDADSAERQTADAQSNEAIASLEEQASRTAGLVNRTIARLLRTNRRWKELYHAIGQGQTEPTAADIAEFADISRGAGLPDAVVQSVKANGRRRRGDGTNQAVSDRRHSDVGARAQAEESVVRDATTGRPVESVPLPPKSSAAPATAPESAREETKSESGKWVLQKTELRTRSTPEWGRYYGVDPTNPGNVIILYSDGQRISTPRSQVRERPATSQSSTPGVAREETRQAPASGAIRPRAVTDAPKGAEAIPDAETPTGSGKLRHTNPAIDGQPIVATTADGRAIVPNPENKTGISIVKPQAEPQAEARPLGLGEAKRILRGHQAKQEAKAARRANAELNAIPLDDNNPLVAGMRAMDVRTLREAVAEAGGDPDSLGGNRDLLMRWLLRHIRRQMETITGTPNAADEKARYERMAAEGRGQTPEQLRATALEKLKLSEDEAVALVERLAESQVRQGDPFVAAEERAAWNDAWDTILDDSGRRIISERELGALRGLTEERRRASGNRRPVALFSRGARAQATDLATAMNRMAAQRALRRANINALAARPESELRRVAAALGVELREWPGTVDGRRMTAQTLLDLTSAFEKLGTRTADDARALLLEADQAHAGPDEDAQAANRRLADLTTAEILALREALPQTAEDARSVTNPQTDIPRRGLQAYDPAALDEAMQRLFANRLAARKLKALRQTALPVAPKAPMTADVPQLGRPFPARPTLPQGTRKAPPSAEETAGRLAALQRAARPLSAYFDTPQAVKSTNETERTQFILDIRAEYRPPRKRRDAGTVWLNGQGMSAIATGIQDAGIQAPDNDFAGVAIHIGHVERIADALRTRAQRVPTALAERVYVLTDTLDTAIAEAKRRGSQAVVLARDYAGEAFDERLPDGTKRRIGPITQLKRTLYEERFHDWQMNQGLYGSLLDAQNADAIHTALKDDETYAKMRAKLADEGYPSDDRALLITEAAAKIASGQWAKYGLESEQEGLDFLHRYYQRAADLLGDSFLQIAAPGTPQARRVQQDVAELRTGRRLQFGRLAEGVRSGGEVAYAVGSGARAGSAPSLGGGVQGGRAGRGEAANGSQVSGNQSETGRRVAPRTRETDINSAQFRAWFGASKATTRAGKPLVLYHGTTRDFDTFSMERADAKSWLGRGFYLTNQTDDAASYTGYGTGKTGGNLMPVYLRAEKPFEPDKTTITRREAARIFDAERLSELPAGQQRLSYDDIVSLSENIDDANSRLQQLGYDSLRHTYGPGATMWVAFQPTQVKSATGNSGAFDAHNSDIRYSGINPTPLLKLAVKHLNRRSEGKVSIPADFDTDKFVAQTERAIKEAKLKPEDKAELDAIVDAMYQAEADDDGAAMVEAQERAASFAAKYSGKKGTRYALGLFTLSRSAVLAGDYAHLRHNMNLALRNPAEFARIAAHGVGAGLNAREYAHALATLRSRDGYEQAMEDGVFFTAEHRRRIGTNSLDLDASLGGRILNKIPLMGRIERANTVAIDEGRMYVYSDLIGIKGARNQEAYNKAVAAFTNAITGRGNVHHETIEHTGAALLTSARYIASYPDSLWQAGKVIKHNPRAAGKVAVYLLGRTVTAALTNKAAVATLAAFGAAGAEWPDDPDLADWRKVRVGDETFDASGGEQAYARTMVRIIDAVTDGERDAESKTREVAKLLYDFVAGRIAPFPRALYDTTTRIVKSADAKPDDPTPAEIMASGVATSLAPIFVQEFAENAANGDLVRGVKHAVLQIAGLSTDVQPKRALRLQSLTSGPTAQEAKRLDVNPRRDVQQRFGQLPDVTEAQFLRRIGKWEEQPVINRLQGRPKPPLEDMGSFKERHAQAERLLEVYGAQLVNDATYRALSDADKKQAMESLLRAVEEATEAAHPKAISVTTILSRAKQPPRQAPAAKLRPSLRGLSNQ